jgi:hypothetical protein
VAVGVVIPCPKFQGFDDNGDPLAAGLLYTYQAGGAIALATYSDVALTVPNANPVVLDAAGRATVYLTPATAYKFVLKTAAGATVWTQDNITVASVSDVVTSIVAGTGVTITYTGAVAGTGAVTVNATGTTYPIASYVPTLANVLNTAAQTTMLSFPVPAGAVADGDVIDIWAAVLFKNNAGGARTVTHDWFWGATTVATSGAVSWADNATERKTVWRFRLMRVGADLWCRGSSGLPSIPDEEEPYTIDATAYAGNSAVMSAPDFTTLQTVYLKLTFSAAHANTYVKPQAAEVIHLK